MLRPTSISVGMLVAVPALAACLSVGYGLGTLRPQGRPVPDDVRTARIVRGADRFSKQSFYTSPDLGLMTDIQLQNHEVEIVGERGAVFLKNDATVDKYIRFRACVSNVVAVRLETGSFLCRGAWAGSAFLFDSAGRTVWSYAGEGEGGAVDDAAAGRLGPSGIEGVVVGLNGGGGVRWIGLDGKTLWKQDDGNVWHVELAAADDKSGNVIVHSNAAGKLTVRDAEGKVLGNYTPEVYLAQFALTAWGDSPRLNKIVTSSEDSIYILSMDGKTVARLPAPGNADIAETSGTLVHFTGHTPYYAGLLRHRLWNRSLLYIYDDRNQITYQEVLSEDCASMHAVPSSSDGDELLLGCKGEVWKYSPRTGSDSAAGHGL